MFEQYFLPQVLPQQLVPVAQQAVPIGQQLYAQFQQPVVPVSQAPTQQIVPFTQLSQVTQPTQQVLPVVQPVSQISQLPLVEPVAQISQLPVVQPVTQQVLPIEPIAILPAAVAPTTFLLTQTAPTVVTSSAPVGVDKGAGTVTTDVFRSTFAQNRSLYSSLGAREKESKEEQEQITAERKLVLQATPCSLASPTSTDYKSFTDTSKVGIRGKAPYIDTAKVGELARNRFYDQAVMDMMVCVLDSVVFLPGDGPLDGGLTSAERVRNWIKKVRQIGGESVEGYAMLATLGQAEDLFVMKAPRDPSSEGLNHEVVVGMYGLNQLRRFVPNFSQVYGFISCSPPLINPEDKKAISYCIGDTQTTYVIYENISGAVSAGDFVETATAKEWLEVYLQALLALREAYLRCGFTHYDLHSGNLLVQKNFQLAKSRFSGVDPERKLIPVGTILPGPEVLEKKTILPLEASTMSVLPLPPLGTLEGVKQLGDTPLGITPVVPLVPVVGVVGDSKIPSLPQGSFQIPYDTSRGRVYLLTKNLARFIDYGFSRIEYKGKSYGKGGFEAYSIFRDRAFPLNDAYRLLMMCGPKMNSAVFAESEKIFSFFNTKEKMKDCLSSQVDYYYSLPWNEATRTLTLDDLIAHITRVCADSRDILSTERGDLVMQCDDECLSLAATVDKVKGFSEVIPYDIISYYDAIGRAKDDGRSYTEIVKGFQSKYDGAATAFQRRVVEQIRDINDQISQFSTLDLSGYTYEQLMSDTTMLLYRNMLTRYISLKDAIETLKFYRKVGFVTSTSFTDNTRKYWYDQRLALNITAGDKILAEIQGIIDKDDRIIDAYVATPAFSSLPKESKLRWYQDKRNFYRIAIRRPQPTLTGMPTLGMVYVQ